MRAILIAVCAAALCASAMACDKKKADAPAFHGFDPNRDRLRRKGREAQEQREADDPAGDQEKTQP